MFMQTVDGLYLYEYKFRLIILSYSTYVYKFTVQESVESNCIVSLI